MIMVSYRNLLFGSCVVHLTIFPTPTFSPMVLTTFLLLLAGALFKSLLIAAGTFYVTLTTLYLCPPLGKLALRVCPPRE